MPPSAHRLKTSQVALLRRIGDEDVTWRNEYRRKGEITTDRLWSSETDYVVVSAAVERLVRRGLCTREHGYKVGSGPVQLTDDGRAVLS